MHPAVDAMRRAGQPFTGFLYAGLILTGQGIKVLEFNARLGDPETQVLMHRMRSDFVPFLRAAAKGELKGENLEWHTDSSVCVVMAAAGYPGSVRSGDPIAGIAEVDRGVVFHAGTKLVNNVLKTAGGRVLGLTASGSDLGSAIQETYRQVEKIHFEGMQYRRDIGRKGLRRW